MASDLITSDNVQKIDRERAKGGRYIPTPTLSELLLRFQSLQEWYIPRDMMFHLFVSMAQLNNPFGTDKDSLENREIRVKADGTVDYTVDPYPFAVETIAQAMLADRHPYAEVYPSCKGHTDERMLQCKQFVQALLDTCMKRSDVMLDMVSKLVVLGWLPTLNTFDPAMKKQGQNPFDVQIIDPMNFYPRLDSRRQVMYGFIQQRVTGAQLVQDFSDFAGVRELIDAETKPPEGTPAYKDYSRHGANLDTTEFDLLRFYDDYSTVLLIGARDATEPACKNNAVLARLRDDTKKGKYGSLFASLDDDDPYAGMQKHNLGGVPLHLTGCFPEALSPTVKLQGVGTLSPDNIYKGLMGGRVVYYPFLYPMYNDWVDRSKLRNMMYTIIDRYARPTRIIYTENRDYYKSLKQGDTVFMSPDGSEKMENEKIDAMPTEFMTMFQELSGSLKENSFAATTFGGRAGSSARQQDAVLAQGSKREEILIRKVQQSLSAYPTTSLKTLIRRGGDEPIFAAGDGKAFDGAYTLEYKASGLNGYVPNIEVALKQKNALKDPMAVTAFGGLQKLSVYPEEYLLAQVLDEPNPKKIIEDAIKEKVRTHDSVIAPKIEVASLESQSENLEPKWKLQEKVQLQTDKYQEDLHHRLIELDWEQLPQDKKDMVRQATIDRVMAEVSGQPGGTPPPPAGGPGQTPTAPGQPPMPTQPGSAAGPPPPALPPATAGPRPPMPGPGPQMMPPPPPHPMMMGGGPPPPMMQHPLPPPMPGGAPGGFGGGGGPLGPVGPRPPMLPPGFGKAPGQADRPIQPISALMPPGGIGRPGLPSALMGGGAGMHGTPIDTPAFEAANKAFAPAVTGKTRKRGSRGKGGSKKGGY